jgi:hypothetical protein
VAERLAASESTFVDRVTAHVPPMPPNVVRIVGMNESGELPDDTTELEGGREPLRRAIARRVNYGATRVCCAHTASRDSSRVTTSPAAPAATESE